MIGHETLPDRAPHADPCTLRQEVVNTQAFRLFEAATKRPDGWERELDWQLSIYRPNPEATPEEQARESAWIEKLRASVEAELLGWLMAQKLLDDKNFTWRCDERNAAEQGRVELLESARAIAEKRLGPWFAERSAPQLDALLERARVVREAKEDAALAQDIAEGRKARRWAALRCHAGWLLPFAELVIVLATLSWRCA